MRVVIVGAGGHGAVVKDALELMGAKVVGFVDDRPGPDVIGAVQWLIENPQTCVVAVGDPHMRSRIHQAIVAAGESLPIVIHPRAVVASSAQLDSGAQVLASAVVNPRARVGRSAIINTACVVEHDCVVEDWAHISPGATLGGSVFVGASSHVGLGAVVLPGCRVGRGAVVGAGAVVTKDVGAGEVVVGVPARVRS